MPDRACPAIRPAANQSRQSSLAATLTASDSAVGAVANAGTSAASAGSVGRLDEPRKKAGNERRKMAGRAGRRMARPGASARTTLGSSSGRRMRRRRTFGQTRLSGCPSREGCPDQQPATTGRVVRRAGGLAGGEERCRATSLDVRAHARKRAGKVRRTESRFSKRERLGDGAVS